MRMAKANLIRLFSRILFMKKLIKLAVIAYAATLLSGCITGHVYNKERNCSYDYLFHPDVSITKLIGGCGPVAPHK